MFKKMNMGKRVLASILLVAVIVLIVGMAGIYGMSWINKSLNEIVRVNLPGTIALEIIHDAQTAIQRDERTLLLRTVFSDEEKVRLTKRLEGAWKRADAAWNIYEPLPKSEEAANAWSRIKPAWETWKKDHQKVFNLGIAERLTEATVISQGVASKSFYKVEELMGEVIAINEKDSKAATKSAERSAGLLKWGLISMIVLSIILAVAIGIRIDRDLTHIIAGLRDEVRTIVNAAIGGRLSLRGDPENVNYEFRDIVKGFNDTLDAVIGPLNVVADYLGRISRGETPPVIMDDYNGDFNLIKNNLKAWIDVAVQQVNAAQKLAAGDLSGRIEARNERDIIAISMNNAIAALDDLRKEIQRLTEASQEGMLSEHGRTEQFQGAYAEIVQDVNQIHERLAFMKNNINALAADASMLAKATVDGNFTTRADAAKHHGDFQKIVSSINEILDAVLEPLKLTSEYKERIAKGEISPKLSDPYKGDASNIFLEMMARNKPYFE
jgi:methyl-accepting chemotaxis protein